VIFILFSGAFTEAPVPGALGTTHYLKMDQGTLVFFGFVKIVLSCMFWKQGRATLKIFTPILKEYWDAERGATQGIQMSERKSK